MFQIIPRYCWNKYQWMEQVPLVLTVQVLEENLVFLFLENLKDTLNEILTGENTLRERATKLIFLPVKDTTYRINLKNAWIEWSHLCFYGNHVKFIEIQGDSQTTSCWIGCLTLFIFSVDQFSKKSRGQKLDKMLRTC